MECSEKFKAYLNNESASGTNGRMRCGVGLECTAKAASGENPCRLRLVNRNNERVKLYPLSGGRRWIMLSVGLRGSPRRVLGQRGGFKCLFKFQEAKEERPLG